METATLVAIFISGLLVSFTGYTRYSWIIVSKYNFCRTFKLDVIKTGL